MANLEQLEVLKQGVETWNQWRKENASIEIDLSRSDFERANLEGANFKSASLYHSNFRGAYLVRANLNRADLYAADLRNANLSQASVRRAKLSKADLREAVLRQVHFGKTDFLEADLRGADLSDAVLEQAQFVDAKLQSANLSHCFIYGISAWGLDLTGANQQDLIITPYDQPTITVNNLEVAQFIFLLLNNKRIRDVINTITTKVVLILGRFTPERKSVLDAIRKELGKRNYVPILFDFDPSHNRDVTETVTLLARMSRFIIADLTEPRSIPLELQAVVPDLAVPVQPVLLSGQQEFSMFVDLRRKYHWVLATQEYRDVDDLLASLSDKVIAPAEQKAKELEKR